MYTMCFYWMWYSASRTRYVKPIAIIHSLLSRLFQTPSHSYLYYINGDRFIFFNQPILADPTLVFSHLLLYENQTYHILNDSFFFFYISISNPL